MRKKLAVGVLVLLILAVLWACATARTQEASPQNLAQVNKEFTEAMEALKHGRIQVYSGAPSGIPDPQPAEDFVSRYERSNAAEIKGLVEKMKEALDDYDFQRVKKHAIILDDFRPRTPHGEKLKRDLQRQDDPEFQQLFQLQERWRMSRGLPNVALETLSDIRKKFEEFMLRHDRRADREYREAACEDYPDVLAELVQRGGYGARSAYDECDRYCDREQCRKLKTIAETCPCPDSSPHLGFGAGPVTADGCELKKIFFKVGDGLPTGYESTADQQFYGVVIDGYNTSEELDVELKDYQLRDNEGTTYPCLGWYFFATLDQQHFNPEAPIDVVFRYNNRLHFKFTAPPNLPMKYILLFRAPKKIEMDRLFLMRQTVSQCVRVKWHKWDHKIFSNTGITPTVFDRNALQRTLLEGHDLTNHTPPWE